MTLRATLAILALAWSALTLSSTAAAQTASPVQEPVGASGAARSALLECIDRTDVEQHGLAAWEMRCPDLQGALQAAGIRPLIISSSQDSFTRASLRQLRNLLHPAMGPTPAVAALGPVLRGLQVTSVAPRRSLWQRLLDWLSEHLAPKRLPEGSYPWLTGILRLLPRLQWLWTAIIWSTIIALPVTVVIIVRREMRAVGKRSIDQPSMGGESTASGPGGSRLALLRQLPPAQRPAQLFALLIARLVAAGRLPPDRSLTHREIVNRVMLEDAEQRRLIESLAHLSERQLYSAVASAPPDLEELLSRAEDLYTTGWSRPVGI